MRIFPEKIKRALKSTLFGLMLAASVTVQSLGAQALGTDSTAAKEETVESPVAMDVVYGYQNTAKSGRFLPLKIELSSQSGQVFNGTLCILAMESDFQGYNMNLDYDVYRYESVSYTHLDVYKRQDIGLKMTKPESQNTGIPVT